ncbi:MAG: hypothetical protein ACPLPR_01250 [Bacillota bacterium]
MKELVNGMVTVPAPAGEPPAVEERLRILLGAPGFAASSKIEALEVYGCGDEAG